MKKNYKKKRITLASEFKNLVIGNANFPFGCVKDNWIFSSSDLLSHQLVIYPSYSIYSFFAFTNTWCMSVDGEEYECRLSDCRCLQASDWVMSVKMTRSTPFIIPPAHQSLHRVMIWQTWIHAHIVHMHITLTVACSMQQFVADRQVQCLSWSLLYDRQRTTVTLTDDCSDTYNV